MYHRSKVGWTKHIDFMALDMLCMIAAYVLAYWIRNRAFLGTGSSLYHSVLVVFVFAQILVTFFRNSFKNVLKRGYGRELSAACTHVLFVVLIAILYLFVIKEGGSYSRIVLGMTAAIYLVLTYAVRCIWKQFLIRRKVGRSERSLMVLTSRDMASEVLHSLSDHDQRDIRVKGIALIEEDGEQWVGEVIEGVPVLAGMDTVAEYICGQWVDEVLLTLPKSIPFPEELYETLVGMGVTVHLRILRAMKQEGQKQEIGRLGGYTVLSSSVNMISMRQLFWKRTVDIIGGIVGCVITGLLCVFIGPVIFAKSPGPIFYSQERVGKNGRIFRLYKFRSMYMDADARKAELMAQNEVKDGMMFKMKNDPRIIGGEKGIGGMIRKLSIDEFPQFWNVLKGDMSLVGTRPPTREEWEKYDPHHRVRLAAKPGITGMWQVNGRSSITDFEDVVRLDRQYILDWSMGLDVRILIKTVGLVLHGSGAW